MNFVAGIDEAGRGPVIGPMVMVIALVDDSKLDLLKKIGVKDSKLIDKKKRLDLYGKLVDILDEYYVEMVGAEQIDALRRKISLNVIEAQMGANLINKLKNIPERIYVDCPDINTINYKRKLESYIDKNHNIIAEHKADMNYLIVGAASIIAKVQRDDEINKLEDKLGLVIGSGYPSDPITKEFLLKNINNDLVQKHIRKSWQTYIDLKEKSRQSLLI